MIDVSDIASDIDSKLKELYQCRMKLKEAGDRKARMISVYDLEIAKTIINLKNGIVYKITDFEIKNPPVTLIDKLARGICYKERLDLDVAENDYKSLSTTINCIQAEINALQTLYRHLDNR